MRRIYIFLVCCIFASIGYAQVRPGQYATVQGRPYSFPEQESKAKASVTTPQAIASGEFTMDDIDFWIGEGENRAAFAVQWNDAREEHALVWGYRWDGKATGIDMIAAICAADPRFFCLSESGTAYGSTVAGMGYDADGSGDIKLVDPSGNIHEIGENGLCPVTGYSYDGWLAADENDYWFSGWYKGYWSYWLKEGNGAWSYSGVGASGRVLNNNSWDGWNASVGMGSYAWKPLFAAETPGADYTKGTFILNEDWFGHANGSINYLSPKGEWQYRAFRAVNEKAELGTTSQFATVYGNKIYILSKQPKTGDEVIAGGRLVVVDAKTLKLIASFDDIGGGDGRSFVGVTPQKGYIAASNGVVTFDIENMKVGTVIEGTGGGSLYSGQIGLMVATDKYVFAVSQKDGLYVIDVQTDRLYKTIEGTISTVAQSKDGSIWAAAGDKLIKVNPETLETATIPLPAHAKIGSSWGAWNAGSFIADPKENVLYWVAAGKSSWSASNMLYRYEIGNAASLNGPFYTLPGDKQTYRNVFYGAGVRLDSRSDQLILTAVEEGYGNHYEVNKLYFLDKRNGDLLQEMTLDPYYWFPAMPLVPDTYAPVFENLESIYQMRVNSAPLEIDLSVSDRDNLDCNIHKAVVNNTNETLLNVLQEENKLILTPAADQYGVCELTIQAVSNGRVTEKKVTVNVTYEPNGIQLNTHSLTMKAGSRDTLTASLLPAGAEERGIRWSTSSYSVANVSNGIVTARNEGTALIYVTTTDGLFADTCEVNVVNEPLAGIALSQNVYDIIVGQKDTLDLIYTPFDASNKDVKLTVADPTIVSVTTYNKTFTGLAEGSTKIMIESADGGFTTECTVNVTFRHADKLTLDTHALELTAPASQSLKYVFAPDKVSNSAVIWSSSDPEIATVSNYGSVTAKKEGVAMIYVTDKNDRELKDSCEVTVKYIALDRFELALADTLISVGRSFSLSGKTLFYPSDASNKSVTWSSSDPEIATISSYGYVNSKKEGEVVITATTEDGSMEASCVVKVGQIPVTGIVTDQEVYYVRVGSTLYMDHTITPSNATNTNVLWQVADESVAAVVNSKYGSIKGLMPGETTATVISEDGNLQATCKVCVTAAVESVEIDLPAAPVIVGDTVALSAVVTPQDARKDVKWNTLDKTVGTVDDDGRFMALKSGVCRVVAMSIDNTKVIDTCEITVTDQLATEVVLNCNESTLHVNDTLQLTAQVYPDNTTNARVRWMSTDPSVATVSSRGFVTANLLGETYIVAIAQDGGGAADSCKLIVAPIPVDSVRISSDSITLFAGEEKQLSAVVYPGNASNKSVVWSSSDETVVSISDRGKVTAIAYGIATITVTTEDGAWRDSCIVSVLEKANAVKLDSTALAMEIDQTVELHAMVQPEYAFDRDLTWKSLDLTVATVDDEGRVTAVGEGMTKIVVALSSDETIADTCTVIVKYTFLSEDAVNGPRLFAIGNRIYVQSCDGYKLSVSDLSGRIVWNVLVEGENACYVPELPDGVYVVYGTNGTQSVKERIVIKSQR